MTQVKFICDSGRHTVSLTIEGHAGAGEKGSDTVCASVSMLGYTFAQYIKDMYLKGKLKKRPVIELDEGCFNIWARVKVDDYPSALNALFVIQTGFCLLEKNYPEYVHIKRLDEAVKTVSEDKSGMLH